MGHTMHISDRPRLAFDSGRVNDLVITEFESHQADAQSRQEIHDGQFNLFDDDANAVIVARKEMKRVTKMPEFAIALKTLKAMTPNPPMTWVRN